FCNGIVQQFFPNLFFIVTFMPAYHGTVLAAIIIKILVLGAVFLVLDAFVPVHPSSANWALYNAGKKMYVLVFPAVDVFVFLGLRQQLHLRRLPDFFRNNRFMLP